MLHRLLLRIVIAAALVLPLPALTPCERQYEQCLAQGLGYATCGLNYWACRLSGGPPRGFSSDLFFQVSYAANLSAGESYINIINAGAGGASLQGPGFGTPTGNICVNVYAFSPDEQLISCCSCLVTPNGLVNLGASRDLTSNTLTQVVPNSIVIKLLATLAGDEGSGTDCTNSAATAATSIPAIGLVAYGTTPHAVGGVYRVTERPFSPATLGDSELASITGRCASILGNGSGHGRCKSCQVGGFGAGKP